MTSQVWQMDHHGYGLSVRKVNNGKSSEKESKEKFGPGKRCVAMFCNNTNTDNVSMHQFPDDPDLKQNWIQFVYHKRDKDDDPWIPGTGHICNDHFTLTDYTNFMEKTAGFANHLKLKLPQHTVFLFISLN